MEERVAREGSSLGVIQDGIDAVFKPHTLPLFALAVLLLFIKLLTRIVSAFGSTLSRAWTYLTCGKCHREEVHELHPPYEQAKKEGKIRGLKDYK